MLGICTIIIDILWTFVNKNVGKHSKIDKVEVMEKPFEKSATQKIRRFVYTSDTEKNTANEATEEKEHTTEQEES